MVNNWGLLVTFHRGCLPAPGTNRRRAGAAGDTGHCGAGKDAAIVAKLLGCDLWTVSPVNPLEFTGPFDSDNTYSRLSGKSTIKQIRSTMLLFRNVLQLQKPSTTVSGESVPVARSGGDSVKCAVLSLINEQCRS